MVQREVCPNFVHKTAFSIGMGSDIPPEMQEPLYRRKPLCKRSVHTIHVHVLGAFTITSIHVNAPFGNFPPALLSCVRPLACSFAPLLGFTDLFSCAVSLVGAICIQSSQKDEKTALPTFCLLLTSLAPMKAVFWTQNGYHGALKMAQTGCFLKPFSIAFVLMYWLLVVSSDAWYVAWRKANRRHRHTANNRFCTLHTMHSAHCIPLNAFHDVHCTMPSTHCTLHAIHGACYAHCSVHLGHSAPWFKYAV